MIISNFYNIANQIYNIFLTILFDAFPGLSRYTLNTKTIKNVIFMNHSDILTSIIVNLLPK